jgi:prepilin-type N-terminal cleavage/methylation domain-containing protein
MNLRPQPFRTRRSGFTMVEIAISLAIIGIALIAIVGVLPLGMNVQKENREGTVVNQDATVFIEAIRNGMHRLDDLTNYVYAITNSWSEYNVNGALVVSGVNGYSYSSASIAPQYYSIVTGSPINSGTNIIGLLSTPEFTDALTTLPINNLFNVDNNGNDYYSNHIVAYVRSISGPAVEKPPQDNQIIQADAFGYRIYCVNAPVAMDTNLASLNSPYNQQLAVNLHELRLTFLWPQLPNGNVGSGRQTWRALIAGQVATNIVAGNLLYFYQPQTFGNAP